MPENIAKAINILGEFCGMRDVPELTSEHLARKFGIAQADVMVLFGGSILCGGDVLAQAMRNGVARKYVIVGGEGHTTEALRRKVHAAFPEIETTGLPEAQVFVKYLKFQHDLEPDFLECNSTNCGNNITYLLKLLADRHVPHASIIICQDASMQRRMDAGLRKYAARGTQIINYAAYAARVKAEAASLAYVHEIHGMWEMDRYISLLLGEIPRLTDDANGYGPKGKDFIAHVDIPPEVRAAFLELCGRYAGLVRKANPLYASDK